MWNKPGASTSSSSQKVTAPQTVEEMKDPRTKLQHKGFCLKTLIEIKPNKDDAAASNTYKGKVFEITDITSKTVTAVECTRFSDDPTKQTVNIDIDEFIVTPLWKFYKGKVAAPVLGINDDSNPATMKGWSVDAISGAITLALRACFLSMGGKQNNIVIYQNPNMVLASGTIKANELVLVPATTKVEKRIEGSCLKTEATNKLFVGSFEVAGTNKDENFFLAKHICLPLDKDGNRSENAWIAPFWFVRTTTDTSKVNCQIKYEQYKVLDMNINIPVLKNTKKINKYEELIYKLS